VAEHSEVFDVRTVSEGVTFYKLGATGLASMRRIAQHVAPFGVSCVQVRRIDMMGYMDSDEEAAGHFGLLGEPEAIGACLAQLVEKLDADIEGWEARFEWAVRKACGEEIPTECEERIRDAYGWIVRADEASEREEAA